MGDHTTLKRDGGWTVELVTPIEGVDSLTLKPPSLDHTIRWAQGRIPSVLALLAELTGQRERILKQLTGADIDRVLVAFSFIAPQTIKDDFQNGRRPLATPEAEKTQEQLVDEALSDNDPVDPRFPRVEGDVHRYGGDNVKGMDTSPPEVMRKVG